MPSVAEQISRKAKRGVSLIEVMLALGLITTAALAIMSVYAMGLQQSVKAEKVLKATEIAREVMENVRELGYDEIPDTDTVFDARKGDSAVGSFPPSPYPRRGEHEIEVLVETVAPGLKSVCVRAYYDKGPGQSVNFQTYFKPE